LHGEVLLAESVDMPVLVSVVPALALIKKIACLNIPKRALFFLCTIFFEAVAAPAAIRRKLREGGAAPALSRG
jgi:hypothetical protein